MSTAVKRPVKQRKSRGVSLSVAGLTFYSGYPHLILNNYPDFPNELPELVREADNIYDENAVAVYVGGKKIGHLPAKAAQTVGPDMDNGAHWYVSSAMVKMHPDKPEQPGVELVIIRDSSNVS